METEIANKRLLKQWEYYYEYLTDETTCEFAHKVLSELSEESFYSLVKQVAKENDYELPYES